MSSIALFGAGSWGTALSVHLASTGRDVVLWARRSQAAEDVRRASHNPTHLSELLIPSSVHITTDLEVAAKAADLWGMAVPSHRVRERARALRPYAHEDVTVVALSKGIETESLFTMSEVLDDVFTGLSSHRIGALYGPSHAEEVAEGRPTTVVAAAAEKGVARHIQNRFMTERLRVYLNTDLRGVEIGGSAKNVLAIAAGIIDGVGYGDNAKAALVTRGLAEIRRLGRALGADPKTFSGLSGIGDMIVTCMSRHSRNRHLGEQIALGKSLDQVLDDMNMVSEGVRTTCAVHGLAQQQGIEMPITEAVHSVLFEDKRPSEMVKRLMTRAPKPEHRMPESVQQ